MPTTASPRLGAPLSWDLALWAACSPPPPPRPPTQALSHVSICDLVYPYLTLLAASYSPTPLQTPFLLSSFSLHPYNGGLGFLHVRLPKIREVRYLSWGHTAR